MNRKIRAILLAALLCLAASGCGGQAQEGTAKESAHRQETDRRESETAPPLEEKPMDLAGDGLALLETESLGGLRFGQTETEVEALLGEPDERTEPEVWAADGRTHMRWTYDGAAVDFADGAVETATVTAPFSGTTLTGVGIGSGGTEIREGYGALVDSEASTEDWIVVGSVYGGLGFTLEDGAVIRIALGVMAE